MSHDSQAAAPATSDSMVRAIQRVTGLLHQVAAALASVDAPALLAAESELGVALSELNQMTFVGDREATRAAAREAQTALLRCKRLGVSFTSAVRAMGRAGEPTTEYTRTGAQIERALSRTVLVRV